MGGRPRTLRQESLRSPWGQVKSTKGFGNFAIPTSGSPGVLGHGEQLWGKKKLKNRSKKKLHFFSALPSERAPDRDR